VPNRYDTDTLRADLSRRSGAARCIPLLHLGAVLGDQFWRIRFGAPEGRPVLDAAIEAIDEALGYLDMKDPMRGRTAGFLGWMMGFRHEVYGKAERDQRIAIELLEEALEYPVVNPVATFMHRITLVQHYLGRAAAYLQVAIGTPQSMMALLNGGVAPQAKSDVDRAVELARAATTADQPPADWQTVAASMRELAEATQRFMTKLGSGGGMGDFGGMFAALGELAKLSQVPGIGVPGTGVIKSMIDGFFLADLPPIDRPLPLVTDTEPPAAAPVLKRPDAPSIDLDATRLMLLRGLADALDAPAADDPAALAQAALQTPLPAGVVDDLVGLATTIVHGGRGAEPLDRFLLGLSLFLRGRDDNGGWGDDDATDLRAAVTHLLVASATLPENHAVTGAVHEVLDAALRLRSPIRGVVEQAGSMPGTSAGTHTVAEIGAALRDLQVDALIQPVHPGTDRMGVLLLDPADLRVDLHATVADALGPEQGRVAFVGATVPWSADRIFTRYSSAREVVELARRTPHPITGRVVFVANPRGDREHAGLEAMVLRRIFHPNSAGLGRLIERADGAGTSADVEAHLPGASLMHINCGFHSTDDGPALELSQADLPLAHIQGLAGLAILADASSDSTAAAEAMIDAGLTGVVWWRDPVPTPVASLMLFVLHGLLVDDGLPPAEAVHAVQRWMLRADRTPPTGLPISYPGGLDGIDLTDPVYRGSLQYRGR
jgi:hypothetical protein